MLVVNLQCPTILYYRLKYPTTSESEKNEEQTNNNLL